MDQEGNFDQRLAGAKLVGARIVKRAAPRARSSNPEEMQPSRVVPAEFDLVLEYQDAAVQHG